MQWKTNFQFLYNFTSDILNIYYFFFKNLSIFLEQFEITSYFYKTLNVREIYSLLSRNLLNWLWTIIASLIMHMNMLQPVHATSINLIYYKNQTGFSCKSERSRFRVALNTKDMMNTCEKQQSIIYIYIYI